MAKLAQMQPKKSVRDSYYKGMLKGVGRGISRVGGGSLAAGKAVGGKAKGLVAGIGLYVFLIFLGGIDIGVKWVIGYEPQLSLFISIILAFIFWYVVKKNRTHSILVVVAFGIDIFVAQIPLFFFPVSGMREFFIAIKVFIWLILGIILFILDFIEHVEKGEDVGWTARLIISFFIVVIIFFSYPYLLNTYQQQKVLHADYFAIAEKELEKVTEVYKKTLTEWEKVYLRFDCSLSEPADIAGCAKKKEAEAKCKPFKKAGRLEEYEDCKNAELGLKTGAAGDVDPRMREPLRLEWVQGEEFDQAEYYVTTTPVFSAKLKIDNPRKEILNLQVGCSFKDIAGAIDFDGVIFPSEELMVEESTKEIEVVCSPQEILEKDKIYQIIYNVRLIDFSTKSTLQYLFFEKPKNEEDKKEIKRTMIEYPAASKGNANAPKDLARLNFNLEKEGYTAGEELVKLQTSIENIGQGSIIEVKKAEVSIVPAGLTSSDLTVSQPCSLIDREVGKLAINQQLILNQKDKKLILGGLCFLKLSENLKNPASDSDIFVFKPVEFEGELIYSYELKKEFMSPIIKTLPTTATI